MIPERKLNILIKKYWNIFANTIQELIGKGVREYCIKTEAGQSI